MIEEGNPDVKSDMPMAANDPRVALEAFYQGILRGLEICFPACVYSYDRSTHSVVVMPLVKGGFFQGEWHYLRRQPFRTTIRNIQSGGYTIDYPVYIGDTGWVFSSDRNTLLIKQNGALTTAVLEKDRPIGTVEDNYQQQPNQPTLHSFAQGFFLPDNWGKWETHRFKDDKGLAIGDALYIGSSIDTKDEDTDGVGEQKGNAYEQKTTSSIVLHKAGGAYMLSSTNIKVDGAENEGEKYDRHSKVATIGDSVEISVSDLTEDTPKSASIILGTDLGLTLRYDDFKNQTHFLSSMNEGDFTTRLINEKTKSLVSVSFHQGQLSITASDAINIFANGDVRIASAQKAFITAEEARVVANGEASVAAKNVSVSASDYVNVAGGKNINVTAGEQAYIVTGKSTTIMSKQENGKIDIQTLGKSSQINLKAQGEGSSVLVSSEQGSVSVTGGKSISVSSETISLSGSQINIQGASTTVNGQPLTYDSGNSHWV